MAKLIDKQGNEVQPGMFIEDFRGEQWKFLFLTRGNSRVYVQQIDTDDWKQEFFPSVFHCTIVA